uniref:Phosphorylase b kinase regulatory subunit n=1 Tax=Romanomermis culicivorax TaxID=13658 RepID=A0A915JED9_ROMCU
MQLMTRRNNTIDEKDETSRKEKLQVVDEIQKVSKKYTKKDNKVKSHRKYVEKQKIRVQKTHDLGLEGVDCSELVEMLYETDNLEEQADILHYLWLQKGPHWDTVLGGKIGTPVRGLVEELYQKACNAQIWWLVRHSAGLLGKKVDDAAKAVTDLLVRQKQVTVGMPAFREETIAFPLSAFELQKLVKNAFGDDDTSVEILVYLGMFVRTEPRLFSEMIRLRIGLILQVMTSELALIGEEASNHLLNLTPYEMKTLLHHVLSGREFGEVDPESHEVITHTERTKAERTGALQLRKALTRHKISMAGQDGFQLPTATAIQTPDDDHKSTTSAGTSESQSSFGQWLRRRRIDGALNRVPADFYPKIWAILRRIEMTSNEIKFALCVESVLNRIAEPEYRQLMVEALMVLTLLASNPTITEHNQLNIPNCIYVEYIVHEANNIFLDDQKRLKGDATACCAREPPQPCAAIADICNFFYDSPPSGCYGTLTYMCRAVAHLLSAGRTDDCAIN